MGKTQVKAQMNKRNNPHFDLIIICGGMVGLALARALINLKDASGESLKIAIIESTLPDFLSAKNIKLNPPDLRVSAINAGAIGQLNTWGLWTEKYFPTRSLYRQMKIWDENSAGKLEFHASDLGQEFLGYIIENKALVQTLWEDLKTYSNMTFFCPDQADLKNSRNLNNSNNLKWEINLTSGQQIFGDFLIGADGTNSQVREFLEIPSTPVLYGQQAIVAYVSAEKALEETAYQRFLSTGPLAFLPFSGLNSGSIVWSVESIEAERLFRLSPKDFESELTTAFENTLGQVYLTSDRAMFPLRHHHANSYVAKNAILIGDAAHGIHPLAGLGVNLGFHDVGVFTEVLRESQAKNRPLLTLGNLKKIERQIWAHNELIRRSMTGINALFSEKSGASGLNALFGSFGKKIRGLGMNSLNRMDIVKNFFSQIAQG